MPDEELVRRALDGSTVAFEQLVRRHQGRLYGFLLQRVTGAQDAEDITQDTFLRAWQRLHQYRPRYRFTTWLFTIGHRLAINHLRRGGKVTVHRQDSSVMAQTQIDHAPSPDARSLAGEARSSVWAAAMDVLSPDELEAMWLRYAEDLTAREISSVMGRTTVGVRVMLHRARQRLQTHLAEHADEGNVESHSVQRSPGHASPPAVPSDDRMTLTMAGGSR